MTRTDAEFFANYPHRSYAELVGPTTMRFTWKCGHTQVKDFSKGPITKRLSPAACTMMATWWSKDRGGCGPACPKCHPELQRPTHRRLPRRTP